MGVNVGQQRCSGHESSVEGDLLNGVLGVWWGAGSAPWFSKGLLCPSVASIILLLQCPHQLSAPSIQKPGEKTGWSGPGLFAPVRITRIPLGIFSSTCVQECRCWVAFPALLRATSCTLEFDTVIIDFFCQMKLILDYLLHQSKYRLLY